jgi:hypothetical protein
LAVEFGEANAVGLVGDEEVKDGPHEREAAVLAREAPITLVRRFTSPKGALEQVRRSPPAAVAQG